MGESHSKRAVKKLDQETLAKLKEAFLKIVGAGCEGAEREKRRGEKKATFTLEDLRAHIASSGGTEIDGAVLGRVFAVMAAGKGTVEFQAFAGAYSAAALPGKTWPWHKAVFHVLDLDGDGNATRADAARWLAAGGNCDGAADVAAKAEALISSMPRKEESFTAEEFAAAAVRSDAIVPLALQAAVLSLLSKITSAVPPPPSSPMQRDGSLQEISELSSPRKSDPAPAAPSAPAPAPVPDDHFETPPILVPEPPGEKLQEPPAGEKQPETAPATTPETATSVSPVSVVEMESPAAAKTEEKPEAEGEKKVPKEEPPENLGKTRKSKAHRHGRHHGEHLHKHAASTSGIPSATATATEQSSSVASPTSDTPVAAAARMPEEPKAHATPPLPKMPEGVSSPTPGASSELATDTHAISSSSAASASKGSLRKLRPEEPARRQSTSTGPEPDNGHIAEDFSDSDDERRKPIVFTISQRSSIGDTTKELSSVTLGRPPPGKGRIGESGRMRSSSMFRPPRTNFLDDIPTMPSGPGTVLTPVASDTRAQTAGFDFLTKTRPATATDAALFDGPKSGDDLFEPTKDEEPKREPKVIVAPALTAEGLDKSADASSAAEAPALFDTPKGKEKDKQKSPTVTVAPSVLVKSAKVEEEASSLFDAPGDQEKSPKTTPKAEPAKASPSAFDFPARPKSATDAAPFGAPAEDMFAGKTESPEKGSNPFGETTQSPGSLGKFPTIASPVGSSRRRTRSSWSPGRKFDPASLATAAADEPEEPEEPAPQAAVEEKWVPVFDTAPAPPPAPTVLTSPTPVAPRPPNKLAEDAMHEAMEKLERGQYTEAITHLRLAMASLVSPPVADNRYIRHCTAYNIAIRVLNEIAKLSAAGKDVDKDRLVVLSTFLAGLPLKKAHRRACLLVAAVHSDSACRAVASLVPDCAPLATARHRPPVKHTCRSCRSACDASLPRCFVCGAPVLFCCLALQPIEEKSYSKCGTCCSTFTTSNTSTPKCPLCTIGDLVTSQQ